MRGFGHTAAMSALALLTTAAPSVAALSFFDVITESEIVAGPPYPTDCHRAYVAHETSGEFECDGQLAIGIRRATDGYGNHIDTGLVVGGDHPSGAGFQQNSCFDAMFHPPQQGGALPEGSGLSFLLELTADGEAPGRLVAIHPDRHVRDPLRYFDLYVTGWSAEILCLVEFGRGVGHELTFLAELPQTVELTAARVRILPQTLSGSRRVDPTEAGTYFTARPDAVFDIDLELDGGPDLDEAEPLMSITVSGRFLGGVSPVEATTWGAIKALYDD